VTQSCLLIDFEEEKTAAAPKLMVPEDKPVSKQIVLRDHKRENETSVGTQKLEGPTF
jgi:hypothetical protein